MRSIEEIINEHQQILYYKKDLGMIRNAWFKNMTDKAICCIEDDYFIGMTKIAIALLNKVSDDLFLNHCCHKGDQFVADNRARDFCELYRYGYLSRNQLVYYLSFLTNTEKYYLFVRLVYPSFYYSEKKDFKEWLPTYKKQLHEVALILKNEIELPSIIY